MRSWVFDYIIHIFEDNSDYRFHLWEIQKYKEFMEFIKKLCVCLSLSVGLVSVAT